MENIRELLKTKKEYHFYGITDKNPLTYSENEKMVFTLKFLADGEIVKLPYAKIMVDSDDEILENFYLEPDENGIFTIERSLSCDGFIRVVAWACDESKEIIAGIPLFEGGAGVDLDKIKCETEEPSDYLDFWKSVRDEAVAIPPEIIFEKDIEAQQGFTAKEYHLKSTAGDYASCLVIYPENAKDKSLPIEFQYIGYDVTSLWCEYFPDRIFVFTNAHDIENFRERSYYEGLLKSPKYKDYGFNRDENKNPDTTYWKKVFIRDFQVLNYFLNHEKFDGKNVYFAGGSQGGFQACNMAAHTDGIATKCELTVPWFCDLYSIKTRKRIRGWRPEPDEGLRYFDTAIAGKYVTCPVYIEAGLGDYICPPSGVTALYNAIPCEKKVDFIQGRTHGYVPPILDTFTLEKK